MVQKVTIIISVFAVWGMTFVQSGFTQNNSTERLTPLSKVLDARGMLDLDRTNNINFDATDMVLYIAEDGTPVFQMSTNEDDAKWDTRFGEAYVLGPVTNLKRIGDYVYLMGAFGIVSDGENLLKASSIARWDGDNFESFPGTFDGMIYDVTFIGTNMYVGGSFSEIYIDEDETIEANNIARWNGAEQEWQPLADGTDGTVFSLLTVGNNIYAGGDFNSVNDGNVSAEYIARWSQTSSTWNVVAGTTLNGPVLTLVADADNIYAGGAFSTGDLNYVAGWDGSNWYDLDAGFNDVVHKLVLHGSRLYAGGEFTEKDDGSTLRYLAVWDFDAEEGEEEWKAPAASSPNDAVYAIVADGSNLYIGGDFTQIGITEAIRVARLTGGVWSELGGGFDDRVMGLAIGANDVLYAGGFFEEADGSPVFYFSEWTSGEWSRVGSEEVNLPLLGAVIYGVAVYNGDLYVGGEFTEPIGDIEINGIARWDGIEWSDLNGGVLDDTDPGIVYELVVHNGALYVGGTFDKAGTLVQPANNIARWNGTAWSRLGAGLTGTSNPFVFKILPAGSDLYVGGSFGNAAGVNVNNLALWDGTDWFDVGGGAGEGDSSNEGVLSLYYEDSKLFVGGFFSETDTDGDAVAADNIAVWDLNEEEWSALGEGVDGNVWDIIRYDGMLIIAGEFEEFSGDEIRALAYWDTEEEEWAEFGGGATYGGDTGAVIKLLEHDGILYVAGIFDHLGETKASSIGAMNDGDWMPLGSGIFDVGFLPPIIFGLHSDGERLWTGGLFIGAGGKSANSISSWQLSDGPVVSNEPTTSQTPDQFLLNQNYPNPFNPSTIISYQIPMASDVRLDVYDMLGRRVATLVNGTVTAGTHEVRFDGANLASGIYIYRLAMNGQMQIRQMTLIK